VDPSHYYSVPRRRLDEAIAESQRALELDPLSPLLQWYLGHRYTLSRQYDRAIEQFCNTLELDPQCFWAHMLLGWCCVWSGKLERGIAAGETAVQMAGRSAMALGMMGGAYGMAGRISEAQKLLHELGELSLKSYVPPMAFVWIYGALGETDSVFDWLERAVDERDGMVVLIPVHPTFDSLRSRALQRKMNLEP
jgi:tetratricopeptide (TPR) repeat protein